MAAASHPGDLMVKEEKLVRPISINLAEAELRDIVIKDSLLYIVRRRRVIVVCTILICERKE